MAPGETLQVTGNYTQGVGGDLQHAQISGASVLRVAVRHGLGHDRRDVDPCTRSRSKRRSGRNSLSSRARADGTVRHRDRRPDQLHDWPVLPADLLATGATLLVAQATLVASATNGPPGSAVTLSGSGYLPGDTITLTFTDNKGVVTTYPSRDHQQQWRILDRNDGPRNGRSGQWRLHQGEKRPHGRARQPRFQGHLRSTQAAEV